MSTMPIELYTDGSSLRNPGPSGLAYVIRYWIDNGDMPESKTIEGNQGFRLSTNNRMEVNAAIYGLKKIIELIKSGDENFKNVTQINLSSDSSYFCDATNKNWLKKWVQNNWMTAAYNGKQPGDVKNKDLWQEFIKIEDELHTIGINLTIIWVKGHNNHEFNELCDKLAVAASNNASNQLIDEVYEKTMRRW